MKDTSTTYYLQNLTRKHFMLRVVELLAWSAGAALVFFTILLLLKFPDTIPLTILSFVITCTLLFFGLKLNRVNVNSTLSFVNAKYPELQESSDLLLKDDNDLTSLQRIQKQKTIAKLEQIYPSIKFDHHIGRALSVLGIGIVSLVLSTSFATKTIQSKPNFEQSNITDSVGTPKLPAVVSNATAEISPPRYTALSSFEDNDLQLNVPDGSVVSWAFTFSDVITEAYLKFSRGDSIILSKRGSTYSTSRKFSSPTLYQLAWQTTQGEVRSSDYYQLEIIPDNPPEIVIKDIPQSTELTINDKLSMDVKASIADDYRVNDSYIIATVAKGSGESVKFREEKLSFNSPSPAAGKNFTASRTIDLKKLGLEPGDEIYFYVEAIDNKTPVAGRSRTETYFITLLDTAEMNSVVDAGLGVDLMPEYFRSQRQIIIDTEKLLRNKKALDQHTFKATSNELGYDQKVLRLKYGEFLGEEFESELAPSDDITEEPSNTIGQEKEQSVTEKFGHVHDTENEHNLVDEKSNAAKHQDHETKNPEEKEDPLKEFVHAHDDTEEATFFLQSVRTKLKAALTEMWDAELYLRLYQPEKSLPYQYKALRLLKEVSNDSRIYVHKTGFDPPPIKEEKRLSADLNDVKESRLQTTAARSEMNPSIRIAAHLLDSKLQKKQFTLTSSDKKTLSLAGQELATLALQSPSKYLSSLSIIKNLNEGNYQDDVEKRDQMKALLEACLKALPQQEQAGQKTDAVHHAMDQSFINHLQKINQ